MHIRKDDQVEVITGDDKGTPSKRRLAKVLRVLPAKNKIVVEGVNRVYKHLKPSAKNQQGGRLSKEMPIDASNVMLYCPSCAEGVRVGHRFNERGPETALSARSAGRPGRYRPRQADPRDQNDTTERRPRPRIESTRSEPIRIACALN